MSVSSDEIWGELMLGKPESKSKVRCPEIADSNLTLPLKNAQYIIGRSRECDIQLGLKMISGHHCSIIKKDNLVMLKDSSVNGTYINKTRRLMNGETHALQNNDEIYIVHRKKDSENDFYFIFKAKIKLETNAEPAVGGCSSSNTVTTGPATVAIKTEPIEHPEPDNEIPSDSTCGVEKQSVEAQDKPNTNEPFAKRIKAVLDDILGNSNELPVESCHHSDQENRSLTVEPSETKKSAVQKQSVGVHDTSNADDEPLAKRLKIILDDIMGNANELPDLSIHHSDEENMAPTVEPPDTKPNINIATDPNKDLIEEGLQCCLCLDILYNPISLQPCQHCYCAGCYCNWMCQSTQCPECRSTVQSLSRNHFVKKLVDAYLKTHAEKERSDSDKERLDTDDTIIGNIMTFNQGNIHSAHYSGTRTSTIYPPASSYASPLVCIQCPSGDVNKKNSKAKSETASTDTDSDTFVCEVNQIHISCLCCLEVMPDRRREHVIDPSVPPQECVVCRNIYCNLYWPCIKPGCPGCITKFKDFSPQRYEMMNAINNNVVESNILSDYLDSVGKTWKDVVTECMLRLERGYCQCTVPLNPHSAICHNCAIFHIKPLVYHYRKTIPPNEIPAHANNRPNCYWGSNCRTQRHKHSHAQKYNHICDQARF